jgi:hypothetical protein
MLFVRRLVISLLQRLVARDRTAPGQPASAVQRSLRNPQLNAVLAVLALVYAVSPIDAVPDILPIVGWLDDGLVLWLGLSQALKAMRGRATPVATGSPTVIETTATRVS